jgi:class 3 adenylate cyclase
VTHDQAVPSEKKEIAVSKTFFEKLHESVQQANEILRGTRAPSRVFKVDGAQPRRIREITSTAIKRSEQAARSRSRRRG